MSARSFAVFMGVLAIVGLLGYGLATKGAKALDVGDPAPDKELERLDGPGTGTIADHRGNWVFVNFWASWCDPCRDEAPALERLYQDWRGSGLVVLGVNLDDNRDDARAFVEEFGLTYPLLRDGDGAERREAFGMTGFPESFLIDPNGRITLIRRGPIDGEYLSRYVEPMLGGVEGPGG